MEAYPDGLKRKAAMPRSDYRTLVNMGRKAGLQTSELYSALASRRPTPQEFDAGSSDSNGFILSLDATGHQVYEPYARGRTT